MIGFLIVIDNSKPLLLPFINSMPHTDLTSYITQFSYFGIFLWFMVIEQLTPIPEEVSLMSVGYISGHAVLNPFLTYLAALLGLLVTDNTLFYLSKKGSSFTQGLINHINPMLLEKIKTKLERKPGLTIFIGALLPKLRFFNPIITGTMNFYFRQFFIANTAATVLYVTVYLSIGFIFHNSLSALITRFDYLKHAMFIALMLLLSALLIFLMRETVMVKKK